MSRSNFDKPFYVDVGTSIVAVRCASNHDIVLEYDHSRHPSFIEFAKIACDRMNKEAEINKPRRNCDVGTAKEQSARFDKFCYDHRSYEKGCGGCPFLDGEPCCELAWAQLPYEAKEGGAK